MLKPIEAFQYLTQDLAHRSHEEQIERACRAGVRWIQLRVKNSCQDETATPTFDTLALFPLPWRKYSNPI